MTNASDEAIAVMLKLIKKSFNFSQLFEDTKKKSEVCRTATQNKRCKFSGSFSGGCDFAHSLEELCPRVFDKQSFKKTECSKWKLRCQYQTRCLYLHDEEKYPLDQEIYFLHSKSEHKFRIIRDQGNGTVSCFTIDDARTMSEELGHELVCCLWSFMNQDYQKIVQSVKKTFTNSTMISQTPPRTETDNPVPTNGLPPISPNIPTYCYGGYQEQNQATPDNRVSTHMGSSHMASMPPNHPNVPTYSHYAYQEQNQETPDNRVPYKRTFCTPSPSLSFDGSNMPPSPLMNASLPYGQNCGQQFGYPQYYDLPDLMYEQKEPEVPTFPNSGVIMPAHTSPTTTSPRLHELMSELSPIGSNSSTDKKSTTLSDQPICENVGDPEELRQIISYLREQIKQKDETITNLQTTGTEPPIYNNYAHPNMHTSIHANTATFL